MATKFRRDQGDWVRFRNFPNNEELDLHFSQFGFRETSYCEAMDETYRLVLDRLRKASEGGKTMFLLVTHGCSTSRPGKTTSRSQVRKLMRSPDATPYIVRKECIEHRSVFVAAIRHTSNKTR